MVTESIINYCGYWNLLRGNLKETVNFIPNVCLNYLLNVAWNKKLSKNLILVFLKYCI